MNRLLAPLTVVTIALLTGCGQQPQLKPESMARSKSVQRAFSDGRMNVIKSDEEANRSILQNSVREQEMTIADPTLRPQLLHFNAKINEWMTKRSIGKGTVGEFIAHRDGQHEPR